jgi:diguanylate cyclase (GGDEF)-like protein/PAS domain S-box-containing protein
MMEKQKLASIKKEDLQPDLLTIQNELLELLANQQPLELILNNLILNVEKLLSPGSLGSILIRKDHGTLGKPVGPSLPKEYLMKLSTVDVGSLGGTCGRAAYTKEVVIVKSIETNPLWDNYREAALPYGLKASWAVPIIVKDKAVGTFAFYYKETKEPLEIEIEIVKSFTRLLAVILEMKKNELLIKENEKKYRMMVNNISDLLNILDEAGNFIFASTSYEKVLGYHPSELVGKNALELAHPEDREFLQETLTNTLKNGSSPRVNFRYLHKDGHYVSLDAKGMVAEDEKDGLTCIIVARDVSEQLELNNEIEESRQRYHSLFAQNLDAIVSLDLEGVIGEANPAASSITGYETNELMTMHFLRLLPESEHEKGLAMFMQVLSGNYQENEFIIANKNGYNVIVFVTAMPIFIKDQISGVYIIAKDITKQKESDNQIHYMAYHDQLTGLPNRHKFNMDLEVLLSDSKKNNLTFSVLYIDLDGFKEVNDLIGHRNGDVLLKEISSRLLHLTKAKSNVYRIGGDEFMVIISNSTIAEAKTLATKFLNNLSNPIKLLEQDFIVTPSIGISQFPFHGKDIDTLIQKADTAMYASKKRGKCAYSVYKETDNKEQWSKVRLRTDLNKALERNELLLHFQPKVDAVNNEIGMEALIRWQHPEFGIISPLDFIPIAEEYGLINDITYWVVEEGLKQINSLPSCPLPITHLSVNVSAYQLETDTNLVKNIEQLLEKYNVDPSFLELEMTETTIMKNTEKNIEILNRFKDVGVQIAIDDFGLNFSSLNYIKHFPIDRIKIDRSFINDLTTNYKDAGIVDLIISLSHKLDMKVTAEGVEKFEQLKWLIDRGCNEIQGYYFAQPTAITELKSQIEELNKKVEMLYNHE